VAGGDKSAGENCRRARSNMSSQSKEKELFWLPSKAKNLAKKNRGGSFLPKIVKPRG
jgi:hypothetical protein